MSRTRHHRGQKNQHLGEDLWSRRPNSQSSYNSYNKKLTARMERSQESGDTAKEVILNDTDQSSVTANQRKGEEEGECNRGACSARPAEYFNNSTLKWYCQCCAHDIQEYENMQAAPFSIFDAFFVEKDQG